MNNTLPVLALPENCRSRLIFALFLLFPVALPLSNVVLAVLLLYWVASVRRMGTWREVAGLPITWALAVLYGLVLLGLFYTPAVPAWYSLHLGKYARLLYAIVLMCLLWGDPKGQRAALNGFCLAMLFILASTWMNVWLVLPWSETRTPGWGVSHHVFGDYITQNVMMSFFAVLLLHRAIVTRQLPRRLGYLTVFVLAFISITHLSAGRTGYLLLGTALTACLMVVMRGRARLLGVVLTLAAGVLALATSEMAWSRVDAALQEGRALFSSDRTSSIGHRIYNYTTTPRLIAERPLIGHGTGAYHQEICRMLDSDSDCSTYSWHPHNQFLFLGADHGLMGVLAFVAIMACMVATALRSSDAQGRALLATLAAMLFVDSLINSPLWSSRESQFFMYMLALLVCMASRKPAEED